MTSALLLFCLQPRFSIGGLYPAQKWPAEDSRRPKILIRSKVVELSPGFYTKLKSTSQVKVACDRKHVKIDVIRIAFFQCELVIKKTPRFEKEYHFHFDDCMKLTIPCSCRRLCYLFCNAFSYQYTLKEINTVSQQKILDFVKTNWKKSAIRGKWCNHWTFGTPLGTAESRTIETGLLEFLVLLGYPSLETPVGKLFFLLL